MGGYHADIQYWSIQTSLEKGEFRIHENENGCKRKKQAEGRRNGYIGNTQLGFEASSVNKTPGVFEMGPPA